MAVARRRGMWSISIGATTPSGDDEEVAGVVSTGAEMSVLNVGERTVGKDGKVSISSRDSSDVEDEVVPGGRVP